MFLNAERVSKSAFILARSLPMDAAVLFIARVMAESGWCAGVTVRNLTFDRHGSLKHQYTGWKHY